MNVDSCIVIFDPDESNPSDGVRNMLENFVQIGFFVYRKPIKLFHIFYILFTFKFAYVKLNDRVKCNKMQFSRQRCFKFSC